MNKEAVDSEVWLSKFKSDEHNDYLMFRFTMQVLDFALLDLDHYNYDARHLSIASIIIVLCLSYGAVTLDQIKTVLINPYSSSI